MYEIQYMDFHIMYSSVIGFIEVDANRRFSFFACDVPEMGLESGHESVFGLSYILLSALLASDTINQVAAAAGYIFHGYMFFHCMCAHYIA